MIKHIIFLLMVAQLYYSRADIMGGAFVLTQDSESNIISHNNNITSGKIIAGKTYLIDDKIIEISTTTNTSLYLSGGIIIDIGANSKLSINLFEQDILNINDLPRLAKIGNHNINITFDVGDFSIIYPSYTTQSYFSINTPITSYQLTGGKYNFKITDISVIAYVYEGSMEIVEDKKTDKREKGKLTISIPFSDSNSGISDKIISSVKTINSTETNKFNSNVLLADKKTNDVQFFIIDKQLVGISLK